MSKKRGRSSVGSEFFQNVLDLSLEAYQIQRQLQEERAAEQKLEERSWICECGHMKRDHCTCGEVCLVGNSGYPGSHRGDVRCKCLKFSARSTGS